MRIAWLQSLRAILPVRKTVPFSAGIRKSASGKCHMDSDRRRCIYSVKDAKQPLAKVAGVTTGKIVDYGIKDSMNMGAVMAPAAAELIAQNLTDFKRKPEDYDRIITGDLGEVGQQILFDLLLKKAWISASNMRTVAC